MSEVYILGGAQTDFERNFHKEGKGVVALLKEVVSLAMLDTKIDKEEIKTLNKKNKVAVFIGNFLAEYYINQGHLGPLLTEVDSCFYGVPSARYEAACASGSVALDAAITKIKAGDYDVCIVIGFELMKTVSSKVGGDYLGRAALYEVEAKGHDYPFPRLFGKLASNTILKYHLNEEQYTKNLATIATINYNNAKRNPNAQTRKWFMNYQQASKRGIKTNELVGDILAVTDCSQVTDGAACVILSSEKYLKEKRMDINHYPIVKGYASRVAPYIFDKKIEESSDNEYILPWTRQTVLEAYEKSGLTIHDMDFFETHDCFTSSEYVAISCFGITEPGREYEVIENKMIDFNGKYPINPSGGLIGCGHPVGATGVRMFLDLYKQVMNKAGDYQIKNAKNGIMLNLGGTASTNYCFIVGMREK